MNDFPASKFAISFQNCLFFIAIVIIFAVSEGILLGAIVQGIYFLFGTDL